MEETNMKDEHMTFPNRNVTELSNQENLHMILYAEAEAPILWPPDVKS